MKRIIHTSETNIAGEKALLVSMLGDTLKTTYSQFWGFSQYKGSKKLGTKMNLIKYCKRKRNQELTVGCNSLLFALSEPTMHWKYIRKHFNKGIKIYIETNGYFDISLLFGIEDLEGIVVKLDSIDREFYLKHHKVDVEIIKKNVTKLMVLPFNYIGIKTLIIPGENDTDVEIKKLAEYIVSINKNITWQIEKFYPSYRMQDKPPTPRKTLEKAVQIGEQAGLTKIICATID